MTKLLHNFLRIQNKWKNRTLHQKKDVKFDYKNLYPLKKFISEKGKITPRRITYIPIQKQRELTEAIKRARYLALLPYVGK